MSSTLRLFFGCLALMGLMLSACGGDDPPAECEAATCDSLEYECGTHSDNCGETITCGTCQAGFDCVAGVCQSCQPETCTTLDVECGTQADGCGGTIECGACGAGSACQAGSCVPDQCTPATCTSLGHECGTPSDTCGGSLSCGTCDAGFSCQAGSCVVDQCVPDTCQDLGVQCGTHDNGCEGTVNCGNCTGQYHECQDGTCVCIARTCADLNRECGEWNDGCGGTVTCGPCQGDDICRFDGRCIGACAPLTCEGVGANCGTINDGCGGTASCGVCSGTQVCGAQAPNQCGEGECTPATCQTLAFQCGSHTDGCGEFIACGPCGANEYCSSQYQCVESAASCDINSFTSVDDVAIYFAETADGPVLHYSADSAAAFPLDRLTIQWWSDYGAPFTGVGTYTLDPNTNPADCGLCLHVQQYDAAGNVTKFFFATEGAIEVTEVGADGEPFAAVLHDAVLAEWGETGAVVGGQTWCIDGYSWNVLLDGQLPVACDNTGFAPLDDAAGTDDTIIGYWAWTADQAPVDELWVEFYHGFGTTVFNGPGIYPIETTTTYNDCGLCVVVVRYDANENPTAFYATEGSVEVTASGTVGDIFSGVLHDVVLVEWDWAGQTAVAGGQNWCLDGFTWSAALQGATSCTVDTECASPTPYCELGSGVCVECLDSTQCSGTDVCQGYACVPPTTTLGDPGDACAVDTDCDGTGAFCFDQVSSGWHEGYCVHECTTTADCISGICIGGDCWSECTTSDECRLGYACDTDSTCYPFASGTGEAGTQCSSILECAGGWLGFCWTDYQGFPDGYCSSYCNDTNPCPGAGVCASGFPDGYNRCLDACATDAECGTGYFCYGGFACLPLETIIDETLRDGAIPQGWTENLITWETTGDGYARFTALDSWLQSPVLDLSDYTEVTLQFAVAKWGSGTDGPITVEISADGGATWTAQVFDSPTPTSATYMTSGPTVIVPATTQVVIRFVRTNSPTQKRLRDVVMVGKY